MAKTKFSERFAERTTKPAPHWKDSRLVVAALSVAGTATFMNTVVFPLMTATMSAKLEALAGADEKIRALQTDLELTKKKLQETGALVAQATAETPFLPGSVYPTGADKLVLGHSLERVVAAYPSGAWDEDGAYYSVKTGSALFHSATYYFDGPKNARKVSSILFHPSPNSPLNGEALRNRFTVLFGPAFATGKRGRAFWKATRRESIDMGSLSTGTFAVESASYVPAWLEARQPK